MRRQKPVIVIALDGAEYSLLQRWCREGYLPTISSLIDNGCWGILDSTASISSGTVWPTTNTGLSPHKQGVFYGHKEFVSGTYTIKRKYANEVNGIYFWNWLSRAGKKVAIFDIPYTYPQPEFDATQIIAWGSFAPEWNTSSQPGDLIDKIISYFGAHPFSRWYERKLQTIPDYESFYSKLVFGVERRCEISEYLLAEQSWDLFFLAFSEIHWAGHLLWHLIDQKHPFYDASLPNTIKSCMRKIYSAVDCAISRLMELRPGATLLIYSPEGMGPNYSGNHILPEVLKRLGMEEYSRNGVRRPAANSFVSPLLDLLKPYKRWGTGSIRRFEEILPPRIIEIFKGFVPRKTWDSWSRRILYAGNGWEKSKAFTVPGEYFGAIRINLKDREPNGLVEPGKEYDEVCQELIERLICLVNLDTGQPAIDEVLRLDNVFNTDDVKHFPDIVVKWKGDAPIKKLYSEQTGVIYGQSNEVRSGAHRPYGFLTAKGDGICKAKVLTGAKIMDLAPTILYLLRQSVPPEMDGRVLIDMFDEKSQ